MSRRLDPKNFDAEKFAWHQRIMHDPAVSPAAKSIVGLLMHDLNPCVGGSWRGQDSMAASLGLSDRHVRRLLKQLVPPAICRSKSVRDAAEPTSTAPPCPTKRPRR